MSNAELRLSHYNEAWAQEFQQEKSCVLHASEGWIQSVEHIGSTCLMDAIARPVIDLVAAYQDQSGLEELSLLIEGINYQPQTLPEWIDEPGVVLLHKPRHRMPTHVVWLVPEGGSTWNRMLQMRQWLIEHPGDMQRFMQFKGQQLQQHFGDIQRYVRAKNMFFLALEDQIDAAKKAT